MSTADRRMSGSEHAVVGLQGFMRPVPVIAAGAVLLKRLDDHVGEPAVDYYDLARRYGSLTSTGARVCLAGWMGLAPTLGHRQAFYAQHKQLPLAS